MDATGLCPRRREPLACVSWRPVRVVLGDHEERPDHGAAVEAFAKYALSENQVGRSETRHNDPNHAVERVGTA